MVPVIYPLVLSQDATLGIILVAGACLFTLTGFLGRYHFLLDLTSHFRLQYLIVQGLGLLILCSKGLHGWSLAVLPFALINLALVLPYYRHAVFKPPQLPQSVPVFRLLHINIWVANGKTHLVAQKIRHENPDLLSLNELDNRWLIELEQTGILENFPYRINTDDVYLFSRIPLLHTQIGPSDTLAGKAILAQLEVEGTPLTIVVAHTKAPIVKWKAQHQRQQMDSLTRVLSGITDPVVLVGDLNTSPWSFAFKRFMAANRLRDTQKDVRLQPTWPASLGWAWIPIDHCLVSPEIITLRRQVGPYVGSDHLPLALDLAISAGKVK